ncbi:Bdf2p SKDI_04G1740 [Saccharomyces kudriavzevii IFO 1802]|uniref:BDF2-like protein n=2 Tax=Saccharomyces kudriavzevii (strain ATCC MYA-4449 / AS 2.2408 / CBS 8840 / NBRC 1802 / NCYC 2889) TaxID=226230 RepID=J5PXX6_SACK1|nr:uncharacterized protein SKDI_04G1740 [Saccharomyces kudriavzevii IFO 1802]EJT44353.1 BDF2-like protein [Saccharomyces kudriavzevii IFO 1802]CAI4057597.1 hypothetical protein SKDI_04G1740 [Saccharomyces kudriavzevii IFO 1802]
MSRINMDTRHAHSALLAAPHGAAANSRSGSSNGSGSNNNNVGVSDHIDNVSAVSIDDGPHFKDIFHYEHEGNYKLASSGITNLNSSSQAHQTLSPISISNASTPESFPEHPLGLEQEPEVAPETGVEGEVLPPHQTKYLLNSIKATKRLKDAKPFLNPVDPIALNIPHYFNYVQTPMDLSLIGKKLQESTYHSVEQVKSDFRTMVNNCLSFNGLESSVSLMAKRIQIYFERKLSAMPPRVLPASALKKTSRSRKKNEDSDSPLVIRRSVSAANDNNGESGNREGTSGGRPKRTIHPPKSKDLFDIYENSKPKSKTLQKKFRTCLKILRILGSKKNSDINFPFLQPVDPIALNLPNYFEIIKNPMDLGTISNNLMNWKYKTVDQFINDVNLVFLNCFQFNPEGNEVHLMGKKLKELFSVHWLENQNVLNEIETDSDIEEDAYSSSYSSDDEYDDEDINESDITNPAIQYLEQKLMKMEVELQQLKKQELSKLSKRRGRKSPNRSLLRRRMSKRSVDDLKKFITDNINELNNLEMNGMIQIIKNSLPKDEILTSNEDEIEIDLDILDEGTVATIYENYFEKKNSGNKKRKSNSRYSAEQLNKRKKTLKFLEKDEIINNEYSGSDEDSSDNSDSDSD